MLAYIILSSLLIVALSAAAIYFYRQANRFYNQAKGNESLETEIRFLNDKIKNQETQKQENLDLTKASVLEAAAQLSNKLIEDHKRESERAKKESEEAIRKTTENLSKNFNEIYKNISLLNEKVETVDVIRRSLLTPSGAGMISEITLENIFKASGLELNRDYELQYVIKDGDKTLRPDAVVFLPNDDVLIVDSKSSSIFIELDHESVQAEEKELLSKLKASMARHLKALADKTYHEVLKNALSKSHGQRVNNIITAMFIPSDIAWDKVRKSDPGFVENAIKQQVFPCGPTGLMNILINSRYALMRHKQHINYDYIIDEIRKMLSQIAELYESARKVGGGIESSARNYKDFIKRFNGSFLNKARELSKNGLGLPAKFPENNLEYNEPVIKTIELESEEVKEQSKKLEKIS